MLAGEEELRDVHHRQSTYSVSFEANCWDDSHAWRTLDRVGGKCFAT